MPLDAGELGVNLGRARRAVGGAGGDHVQDQRVLVGPGPDGLAAVGGEDLGRVSILEGHPVLDVAGAAGIGNDLADRDHGVADLVEPGVPRGIGAVAPSLVVRYMTMPPIMSVSSFKT